MDGCLPPGLLRTRRFDSGHRLCPHSAYSGYKYFPAVLCLDSLIGTCDWYRISAEIIDERIGLVGNEDTRWALAEPALDCIGTLGEGAVSPIVLTVALSMERLVPGWALHSRGDGTYDDLM